MNVVTSKLFVETRADGGMHDITEKVQKSIQESGCLNGTTTLFVAASTASISTVEFEPGLQEDIPAALDRIAPKSMQYAHENTWHDDNGRSHVKATLMGPALVVPFVDGILVLGTWQQIVLFEWDTRDRKREVVVQVIGV